MLAAAAAVSAGVGAVPIEFEEVMAVLARRLGLETGLSPSFQATAVLLEIRIPRILMGMVVGAGLGVAGAALQGLLRNPLADPQLLGIGPGASVGAVLALVALGDGTAGSVAGGVVGAMATVAVLRRLANDPTPGPTRLILSGVALGAVLSAWVGFLVFSIGRNAVPPIEFWLLGSLTGATWRTLATTAVICGGALVALVTASRSLDLLALGENQAQHLGVDVELIRSVVLYATAVAVGSTVGAAGVIGFIGLLVPHLTRRLLGPQHRTLLIGSALLGALFITVADIAARTLASPVEVPVGLLTAAFGGPFFLWLTRRVGRAI